MSVPAEGEGEGQTEKTEKGCWVGVRYMQGGGRGECGSSFTSDLSQLTHTKEKGAAAVRIVV